MTERRNIFDGRKAALIDMDGVLYDSMPGHTLAWKRMMEDIGVECSRDEFYLYEGMTGAATVNLLYRRAFGHDCEPDRIKELYALKSRYFRERGPVPVMPGAARMLKALSSGGLKRVLVTGSGQASLLESIQRDYPDVFPPECRITAHDVVQGKPAPEPYLRGAAKAGVQPGECIVVENAPLGVRAGKAAGCFTIAVTTGPIPREEFEKENADMIFPSMESFADFLEEEFEKYSYGMRNNDEECVSRVIYVPSLRDGISAVLDPMHADRVFMLSDSNVIEALRPDFEGVHSVRVIAPGEESKSIDMAWELWEWLVREGATRNSVLLNLGGGVVTDLGGFVAATFKRGIRFVNVPTTLLGCADAAIGGKTGVDFMGLKNEIGVFAPAEKVVVCPEVLETLPEKELKSGFAEIVKMAMITDTGRYESLLGERVLDDPYVLCDAMRYAAVAKEKIVNEDPKEKGLRRILNFGHTAGHAYESYAARTGHPISHGEAVAHGMLKALELSRDLVGFPAEKVDEYREKILERYYAPLPFGPEADGELSELMAHDKKNPCQGSVRFILLCDIGDPVEKEIACDNI